MVFTKLILVLGIFVPLLGMADPRDYMAELRDYEHPMILKPYIIRDGATVIADKNHWIKLPWENFVVLCLNNSTCKLASGQGKLLFKYEGVIMTCPMDGYKCLQEDDNATEN